MKLYANAYERSLLLRDFYGKEATLFTVTEGSEADKEKAKKGLRGVLEGTDPERRKRVMDAVKDNFMSMYATFSTFTYFQRLITILDSIILTRAPLRCHCPPGIMGLRVGRKRDIG